MTFVEPKANPVEEHKYENSFTQIEEQQPVTQLETVNEEEVINPFVTMQPQMEVVQPPVI